MTKEEMRKPMIGAIRGCISREQLNHLFDMFKVADTQEKFDLLKEAMYNPEIFFSTDEDTLSEQQYETLVGAFLSRIWEKDE
jgi:hypothetical protein